MIENYYPTGNILQQDREKDQERRRQAQASRPMIAKWAADTPRVIFMLTTPLST